MDIDIDSKLEETEFWLQGDAIHQRCFVCNEDDAESFKIFETTTSREHKLDVCLAAALQIDITTNAAGSEVICKYCQHLVEKAELLEMQLESIHKELRGLYSTTLLKSADVEISNLSFDEAPQITPASPEPRKKPRKDQHVPRKELPPLISTNNRYEKRKRGRPTLTETKKFKLYNLESNNKTSAIISNSQIYDKTPTSINKEQAALIETHIADNHFQQDNVYKSMSQNDEALTKQIKSKKNAKLHMKLKQDELKSWLEKRCVDQISKQEPSSSPIKVYQKRSIEQPSNTESKRFKHDIESNNKPLLRPAVLTDNSQVNEHTHIQEQQTVFEKNKSKGKQKQHMKVNEIKQQKSQKVIEHKQGQHMCKNKSQNKAVSVNSLQKHKQIKTAPETCGLETQLKRMYKVQQISNSSKEDLVLKFKKIPAVNVKSFDSDSDHGDDHSQDKEPDFKLPVNRYGLRFKRTKYLRKHLAGKDTNKIKIRRKRKLLKQKSQTRMDATKAELGKENAFQHVNSVAEKTEAIHPEPESDRDKRNEENKKQTGEPDWLNVKLFKDIIHKSHETEASAVSLGTSSLEVVNSPGQTLPINKGDREEINPFWVGNDYSLHEELIIKDEIDYDLGEINPSSDTCDTTNPSQNFNKINIKTEIVESENEFEDNITEHNFSQTPVKYESVQIKNELLDSMCAKMEVMFPCSNRNSHINCCNGDEYKNFAYQIWSTRPIKLSPQRCDSDKECEAEYFCDICGEDFNSVESLKNHIEVDHFTPNY